MKAYENYGANKLPLALVSEFDGRIMRFSGLDDGEKVMLGSICFGCEPSLFSLLPSSPKIR